VKTPAIAQASDPDAQTAYRVAVDQLAAVVDPTERVSTETFVTVENGITTVTLVATEKSGDSLPDW
jgi:hypothetical protein